nr:hypothetical protein SHINE37_10729 [Rhizobiaceae bacterium]
MRTETRIPGAIDLYGGRPADDGDRHCRCVPAALADNTVPARRGLVLFPFLATPRTVAAEPRHPRPAADELAARGRDLGTRKDDRHLSHRRKLRFLLLSHGAVASSCSRGRSRALG